MSRKPHILLGRCLSFLEDPRKVGGVNSCWYSEKAALVIGGEGRILWSGEAGQLPEEHAGLPVTDHGMKLIMAGFIDAHVHYPQYRMLAAPASDLLSWLNRFTFREEARYGDEAHAARAADLFLDRLIDNGTTTALAFSSVHRGAAEILFKAAEKRGLCFITGKTMMDCNAPEEVRDDAASGFEDSAALIADWHNRDRLRYAITVRFAVTSSEAQLEAAGALYARHPDCLFQTHLSESAEEIEFVRRQFPWATDYTDVYDRFGLIKDTAQFAHGIHLSERECQRLHEAGAAVVHCPTSNNFLGSGLFDINHLSAAERPVKVGLATDVAGGTSYSMLQTMGEAYKVAMLKGASFSAFDGFYLATLGNARNLGLAEEIGNLDAGCWADLVVLDPEATPVLATRNELSENLEDLLFSLMMLGDDRAVSATYVRGRRISGKE